MACRSSAECRFARENAMRKNCFALIPSALCAAAPAEVLGWSESHQVRSGATRAGAAIRSSAGAIRSTQCRPDFAWGGTNLPEDATWLIGRRRGGAEKKRSVSDRSVEPRYFLIAVLSVLSQELLIPHSSCWRRLVIAGLVGQSLDRMPATRPLRIGFVGDACDSLTGRCLDGMVAYARFHDAISIVDLRTACNGYGQTPDELPAWLGEVDGIVRGSLQGMPDQPLATWPRLLEVPTVSLHAEPRDGRHAVIDVDPDQVASLAIDHLFDIGVASFLHVGVGSCPGSNRRAQGFVRVLDSRGRTATLHDLAGPIVGDLGDARALVEESRLGEVLAQLPKPIGLLSLDDRIAKGIVFACQALGLAVPGDVAVVGVGDSPVARLPCRRSPASACPTSRWPPGPRPWSAA
jgi:hypothetical protein